MNPTATLTGVCGIGRMGLSEKRKGLDESHRAFARGIKVAEFYRKRKGSTIQP